LKLDGSSFMKWPPSRSSISPLLWLAVYLRIYRAVWQGPMRTVNIKKAQNSKQQASKTTWKDRRDKRQIGLITDKLDLTGKLSSHSLVIILGQAHRRAKPQNPPTFLPGTRGTNFSSYKANPLHSLGMTVLHATASMQKLSLHAIRFAVIYQNQARHRTQHSKIADQSILLLVCRPLSPNYLIPVLKKPSSFIFQLGCCGALHPLGGADTKQCPFLFQVGGAYTLPASFTFFHFLFAFLKRQLSFLEPKIRRQDFCVTFGRQV